ncbi:MAG: CRISPR-associated protein Cas2 [Treponema sp.]|nr:CRISPR-associated protein Cas2 [Treponema sp.]
MFVSVILDPGSTDTAHELARLMLKYGFKKVQAACWEQYALSEKQLAELKRAIDRATNYYDTVRIYQFPVNDMFAVTEMRQKKWRRGLFRSAVRKEYTQ